jgi:hypothetical protein
MNCRVDNMLLTHPTPSLSTLCPIEKRVLDTNAGKQLSSAATDV